MDKNMKKTPRKMQMLGRDEQENGYMPKRAGKQEEQLSRSEDYGRGE